MSTLLRDFRFALRQLRKNPGFTTVAVIALALGIGLSTTIFSVFYNGVLHPFPYRDAERLTVISVLDAERPNEGFRSMFRLDEVSAFRNGNHTFDDIVAYSSWDVPYVHNGTSEQVHGCMLTPNAMEFWGVSPLIGRGLAEGDSHQLVLVDLDDDAALATFVAKAGAKVLAHPRPGLAILERPRGTP